MVKETAVKLCECGCGQPAPIAKYSWWRRNYIKGQPVRFIVGHNAKLSHHGHPQFDWSNLPTLYLDKKLSSGQIAKILGCSTSSVCYSLKKLDIPRRTVHEQRQLYYQMTPRECRSAWRGGKHSQDGYILIYQPEHPLANSSGYVFEHRLVMEQKLGRYLLRSEKVHHINGIRNDNQHENLEVLSSSNHMLRENFCRACTLKNEIRLLRWQIKELAEALQLKLKEGI